MLRRSICMFFAALCALAWLRPAAAAAPQITTNSATSDFGQSVSFTLDAQSEQPITDVTLLYTFGASDADKDVPAFVEATPDWQPGSSVHATFTRDTTVEYLPVGVTIRYKWALTQADGTTTETPEQLVRYDDTRFSWRERSARGITIRWYAGDDAWGDQLLATALAALDRLEQRIGGTVPGPMMIMIYETTSDMRAALPPNSADWIGGQARPDLGLIIGAIAPGNDAEVGRLIPHELSHLVLYQATENNYGGTPVWFDEGLAVANQDSPDFGFTARVKTAASDGELIPLRALASSFPNDPEKALLSYAQSESIVRYIEATYGVDGIARLVDQFRQGVTDDVAIESALGVSLDTLDDQWRATMPAAERTPVIANDQETAPSSRFTDSPRQRPSPNAPGLSPSVGSDGLSLPLWIWAVGGVGALLILVGGVWVVRELRVARR